MFNVAINENLRTRCIVQSSNRNKVIQCSYGQFLKRGNITPTNFAVIMINTIEIKKHNWINWVNISAMSENIPRVLPIITSFSNLYEKRVILLLYTVTSVSTSCTSIKLYWSVVNTTTELLEKTLLLDLPGGFKRILGRINYKQEGQFWKFTLGLFLLSYQG